MICNLVNEDPGCPYQGISLMNHRNDSIFREYYSEKLLEDRFIFQPEKGVDVIVPVIHTNELWYVNLLSFLPRDTDS